MTSDINDWWSITVFHGRKIGPKRWRATANAFRRDTQDQVGEDFVGFGTTMNTADKDALRNATSFALMQGKPSDWKE